MEIPAFFLYIFPFISSLLLGFLGDLLFSIPNGLASLYPLFKGRFSSLLAAKPWFSFYFPTFIGIILAGFLTKNFTPALLTNIDYETINIIRIVSTITIIYRIALGLDFELLKTQKSAIFLLSLLPNLTEALFITFFSSKLFDLQREFALCLGFEASGASTAILMPILLRINEENAKKTRFLPAILLAASVFDNIFSIFMFNFSRTLALAHFPQSFPDILIQRLEGMLIGTVFGLILGFLYRLLSGLLNKTLLFLLSYTISVILVFWLDSFGYRGAGFISIWLSILLINSAEDKKLPRFANNCWKVLRLWLFFFIGSALDLKTLSFAVVCSILALILLSTTLRVLITGCCLAAFQRFSWKEVAFGSLTSLSKASLQAALGTALFYESITKGYAENVKTQALIISQISIFYILVTGPLGAILLNKYEKNLLGTAENCGELGELEERIKLKLILE